MKFSKFNEIDSICKNYNLVNYTINPDGSVDVDGDVNLKGASFYKKFKTIEKGENWTLNEIPIKFRYVSGDFDCRCNNLVDLKGCPIKIGGNLYLYENKLKSLEGCPEEVNRLLIGNNELESLKGCPMRILGDFNCSNNKLTSLEFGPISVGGYYSISDNPITDPIGFHKGKKMDTIFMRNTPLSKLVSLLVESKCACSDVSCSSNNQGGQHNQDWELIAKAIEMINQYKVVDGNDLNITNLQRL